MRELEIGTYGSGRSVSADSVPADGNNYTVIALSSALLGSRVKVKAEY